MVCISECAISPWREMGAYEALWLDQKARFKSIAQKFRANPGALPSDFFRMQRDIPERVAKRADALLHEGGVKRYGVRLSGSGEYPRRLRDAEYPVELLYFLGYWDLVETRTVAVVGTRKPSLEGKKRAEKITRSLARDGFTVVSGLASGIDTVVHTTAIAENARTIGVIGTPLSSCYPRDNKPLQDVIARDYLLITQVPVCRYHEQHWKVNRGFFPERNVTMSALTEATIIVEASDTSGTLIQARAAIKQKRKLFILDSCFRMSNLKWPHTFEARGAVRVKNYEDVARHLA